LSLIGFFPATKDRQWIIIAAALVLVSAVIGTVVRRLGGGEAIAKPLQLLPGVAFWFFVVGTNAEAIFAKTAAAVVESVAPMDPEPGFRIFAAIGMWLVYWIVELLAVGIDDAVWAFPLLFTPYLIPALATADDISGFYYLFPAAGFLILLTVSQYRRALGLGSFVAAAFSAALVGALAVAGSVGIGVRLPTLAMLETVGTSSNIRMRDPSADISRNLRAARAVPVLTYSFDQPRAAGTYLRLVALPELTEQGYGLVQAPLTESSGTLTPEATPGGDEFKVTVKMADFASQYLPLPWGTSSFSAAGSWTWGPAISALLSRDGGDTATVQLEYTATATVFDLSDDQLRTMSAGQPDDKAVTLGIPTAVPDSIHLLAADFRAARPDAAAGELAVDLRDWLSSDDFTYDTATRSGDAMATLDDFLLRSRSGYCEQFAGSYVLLARMMGIPARMVIGFLPGSEKDGTWSVTTHNMHAWAEIYLDGYGWAPIDPTPGSSGTRPSVSPSPASTPSASAAPTRSATPSASATPTAQPANPLIPSQSNWPWLAIGGVAALATLAAAPRLIRVVRARRRLGRTGPLPTRVEDAWEELRDRILDSGGIWPGGTPRQVAARLADTWESESAIAAIRELALRVEEARFAQGVSECDPATLLAAIPLKARASLVPRSLLWNPTRKGRHR
jgi:transglutaminase-like putative cysteine protease